MSDLRQTPGQLRYSRRGSFRFFAVSKCSESSTHFGYLLPERLFREKKLTNTVRIGPYLRCIRCTLYNLKQAKQSLTKLYLIWIGGRTADTKKYELDKKVHFETRPWVENQGQSAAHVTGVNLISKINLKGGTSDIANFISSSETKD